MRYHSMVFIQKINMFAVFQNYPNIVSNIYIDYLTDEFTGYQGQCNQQTEAIVLFLCLIEKPLQLSSSI